MFCELHYGLRSKDCFFFSKFKVERIKSTLAHSCLESFTRLQLKRTGKWKKCPVAAYIFYLIRLAFFVAVASVANSVLSLIVYCCSCEVKLLNMVSVYGKRSWSRLLMKSSF